MRCGACARHFASEELQERKRLPRAESLTEPRTAFGRTKIGAPFQVTPRMVARGREAYGVAFTLKIVRTAHANEASRQAMAWRPKASRMATQRGAGLAANARSGPKAPVIPIQTRHHSRLDPATDSD